MHHLECGNIAKFHQIEILKKINKLVIEKEEREEEVLKDLFEIE